MGKGEINLDNFDWDNMEEIKADTKDSEGTENETTDSEETVSDDVFNFEENVDTEDDDSENEDSTKDSTKDKTKVKQEEKTKDDEPQIDETDLIVSFLKNNNLLTLTDEDIDDDDTPSDLFNKEVDARVEASLEDIFSEVKADKQAVALIKHLQQGGDVNSFINSKSVYTYPTSVDTEEQQENVIRFDMKRRGVDDDTILDAAIEKHKLNGTLGTAANNIVAKYTAEQTLKLEQDKKAAKEKEKEKIEKHKKFTTSLASVFQKSDLGGLGKNKKDVDLIDFIAKPIDNNGHTAFNKAIDSLVNDPAKHEQLLMLAKLLNTNFDLSKVSKTAASKEVTKIKQALSRDNTSAKTIASSRKQSSSLADHF